MYFWFMLKSLTLKKEGKGEENVFLYFLVDYPTNLELIEKLLSNRAINFLELKIIPKEKKTITHLYDERKKNYYS